MATVGVKGLIDYYELFVSSVGVHHIMPDSNMSLRHCLL